MNQETASQRLYYEIQSHLSDLRHATISWNVFQDRMEQSYKDSIAFEKQQIADAYDYEADADMQDYSSGEQYYEQTFIF